MRIRSYPFLARIVLYMLLTLASSLPLVAFTPILLTHQGSGPSTSPDRTETVSQAFEQAAQEFHVPSTILEAICYMEGRLSANGGNPSVDDGFGCMHLVQDGRGNALDRAARELGVSVDKIKLEMPTNIRGGADLLRDYALQLSSTHSLPTKLSDWYGAIAAYSNATTRSTALMYAEEVYKILDEGFSAEADDGETITLLAQAVRPNVATAAGVKGSNTLPSGCKVDHKVDYPGAVDCLVPVPVYDCNQTPKDAPCTFEGAQRPNDYAIDQIVIHDVEGTAQNSLSVFQNPQKAASAHYIVASDGTIYQVILEKDIAYHAGNYWYNQHSIGIEHAGVDATGYRWYNAAEYLASAKLTAYLLKKYKLPLSHERIVSHGTIPSPSATGHPNHVDPGPYWLWDYYFKLIHQQGVPFPTQPATPHILMLHPASARRPLGKKGREIGMNFNFFYLYNGPSTAAGRIPQQGNGHDITDVSGCVEPDISYYYETRVLDPAGSGDMLYKIWYGVEDQLHGSKPSLFAHARLVWLAVPRGAVSPGKGTLVTLHASNGQPPQVYGRPTTGNSNIIGTAPAGATFASTYTVIEDGTDQNQNGTGNQDNGETGIMDSTGVSDGAGKRWYEINYNHRQAWVPSDEVTPGQSNGGQ